MVKGAPSVMTDLKELYFDNEKIKAIGELLMVYLASMDKFNTLDGEAD